MRNSQTSLSKQQRNQQEKRNRLCATYQVNPVLSLEENFLVLMNPSLQKECAANPSRCYLGDAPSLAELRIACNSEFAASWIMIQLNSVAESVCDKDKIPTDNLQCASYDILNNYSWLKTSEIMLFCSRVRAGIYGKLSYGTLSMDDITSKLSMFVKARDLEIVGLERDAEREKREEEYENMKKNAVSKEESMRIINAAADGDVEAQHILHDDPEAWKMWIYEIEFLVDDDALIEKITGYFGVNKNFFTGKLTAYFENDRYGKFLEGEQKGYYKIKR